MNKRTAGLALAAVTGFSILSATPAFAVPGGPYENCTEAAGEGVYNIQLGDYRYADNLDNGGTPGLACEDDSQPLTPIVAQPPAPTPEPTTTPTPPGMPMPKGGVDAGVVTEKGTNPGSLALAGGLVLAAAAGAGTYAIRRRSGNHA
ncbi:hypothetical protein AAE021_14920 [Arthrobacter citreus]|uniref:Excalibur calcium-binding domain-containing protein n=1 Tax=Arthrobacter citreus TaxID=1670 RepID=A0ABZ2ZYT6_9MICC